MLAGAYSERFQKIQQQHIDHLKEPKRGGYGDAYFRSRHLQTETNKRRKAIAIKRKLEAEKEERRRKEILAKRSEDIRNATERYQRLSRPRASSAGARIVVAQTEPAIELEKALLIIHGAGDQKLNRSTSSLGFGQISATPTQCHSTSNQRYVTATKPVADNRPMVISYKTCPPDATRTIRTDSLENVTNSKNRFEEQLVQQQKRLAEQQKQALDQFNAAIAHELDMDKGIQGLVEGHDVIQRSDSLESVDSLEDVYVTEKHMEQSNQHQETQNWQQSGSVFLPDHPTAHNSQQIQPKLPLQWQEKHQQTQMHNTHQCKSMQCEQCHLANENGNMQKPSKIVNLSPQAIESSYGSNSNVAVVAPSVIHPSPNSMAKAMKSTPVVGYCTIADDNLYENRGRQQSMLESGVPVQETKVHCKHVAWVPHNIHGSRENTQAWEGPLQNMIGGAVHCEVSENTRAHLDSDPQIDMPQQYIDDPTLGKTIKHNVSVVTDSFAQVAATASQQSEFLVNGKLPSKVNSVNQRTNSTAYDPRACKQNYINNNSMDTEGAVNLNSAHLDNSDVLSTPLFEVVSSENKSQKHGRTESNKNKHDKVRQEATTKRPQTKGNAAPKGIKKKKVPTATLR